MILIRKIYNGDNFAKIELKVLFQSSSRAGGMISAPGLVIK